MPSVCDAFLDFFFPSSHPEQRRRGETGSRSGNYVHWSKRASCVRSARTAGAGGAPPPCNQTLAACSNLGGLRVLQVDLGDETVRSAADVADMPSMCALPGSHMRATESDTRLVSPLPACAQPRPGAGNYRAAALHDIRRAKEGTYPELL